MSQSVSLLSASAADPLYFGRYVLGRTRWGRQEEMRRAVDTHRRVIVRSANGVGKTFELGSLVCEWLVMHPGSRVICTGPTYDAVRKGLWQEVRRAWRSASVRLSDNEPGTDEWVLGDQWDAGIVSVTNISAAHGRRGKRVLIIVDEAQGVDDPDLWDAFDSLMSSERSRMIVSGNPLWPQGRFFDYSTSPAWHPIRIDGFEHPNILEQREVVPGSITQTWIDEKREEWGEDDPRWCARVRGEFPEKGDRQLVPLAVLEAGKAGTVDTKDERRIGLDVARFGGDRNVLIVLDETRAVIHIDSWAGEDLMSTTGRLRHAVEQFKVKPEFTCVDVCGIGAGVVDRCREGGLNVTPVDFGEAARGDWGEVVGHEQKYRNRKGELHDVMRALLKKRQLSVGPQYRPLWSDLASLTFSFDGNGRFMVEDKEALRKRIGRSPDHSDALAIALGNRERRWYVR